MYVLRLLKSIGLSYMQGRMDLFDTSSITFRVLPHDIDINMHMNNGKYLSIMDFGRTHLLTRAGLLGLAIRNRWQPLIGSADIEFKKPIMLFESYTLKTKMSGWDKKWFYLEQQFEKDNTICAVGRVKGLLRGKNGNIKPEYILHQLGIQDKTSPNIVTVSPTKIET